ncbi:MAG: hypothetical protein AAF797_02355 [Planctomycetota bacterium]
MRPTNRSGDVDERVNALVAEWQAKAWRWLWLRLGLRWSLVYLLAWGTVVLLLRVSVEAGASWMWWAGLGLLGVWGVAGWWSRRSVPARERVLTLLDRENRMGGVLMSGTALGGEVRLELPRVRWRGGPNGLAVVGAVVFVVAAMVVPMPESAGSAVPLEVGPAVSVLEEQVEVLEEERVLDRSEAERLREAAKQIEAGAQGSDPSKTWEALDHLAEEVQQSADEAVELAKRRAQEAAAAGTLAEALEQGGDGLTPEQRGDAMRALSDLMEAAAGEPTLGGMELPEGLAEALAEALEGLGGMDGQAGEGMAIDPELLEQLAEAMRGREGELREMLEALGEAGLADGEAAEGGEMVDASELLEFLEGCEGGQCSAASVLVACKGAGSGGINRGPGHVELTWQDPSSEEGAGFEPEALPRSRVVDVEAARRLGVTRGRPEAIEGATGSAGSALEGAAAGDGSAMDAVVLPRHRGAVRRYFDRAEPTADVP